jgi:hypothetical protein
MLKKIYFAFEHNQKIITQDPSYIFLPRFPNVNLFWSGGKIVDNPGLIKLGVLKIDA